MKKILLFVSAVFGNLTILLVCFLLLTVKASKSSSALQAESLTPISDLQENYSLLEQPVLALTTENVQIIAGDAAVILVDNYFKKYNSPMTGQGKAIVAAAHKYQIPYALLPAIGQCEGNLGKSVPPDSFNTWGFGIYGQTVTKFSSWEEAIETISKALRRDYFDYGMDTPEKMMPKYAPPSDGSWARCVNRFLAELE